MFIDPYQIRHAIRNGISIVAGGAVQLSAGTTSSARSDFTFSNSPSVTFGLNGAGVITASVAPAAGGLTNIKVSAGTLSALRSDITFSNSNGVSFGLNAGGVITATVATNYQSPGAYLTTAQPPGAYLTTAALSQDSSKYAGTGFTTATTAGTNIVGTLATNGISMGVPAYLTAASGGGGAGTGFTTASTSGTDIVGTLDTAGLSMGIPPYLTTASIYFAAAGNSNSLTGVLFLNSNNVTFGLSGDIYTASAAINVSASGGSALVSAITFDNSNNVTFGYDGTNITASIATTYAGTGITTATTAGTAVVGTLNTSGLSLGIPAYLTTAAVSGAISALNISAGSTSSNVGAVTFSNGSGVTFGYDGTNVTASVQTNYQTPGAYLTTAQPVGVYAGTGFTSTTTGGTNIVATLNTSGLSMGIPAYLTTAAAAGLSNIKVSAGTLSALRSDITFANSNSVSFGLNSLGVITASVNPDPAIQISAGTTSTERQDFTFINSNNITFGLGTGASAGHITASFADGDTWAGTNTSVVTTAGSDLSFAVNTSGMTIAYPKWLTTAAAGGGVAISNSQSLFSTGTVGFSAGGGAITIAGSTSVGGQSLMFSVPQTSSVVGSGMISIGTAGSTINISAPNTSSIVGAGVISISTNVSTISILAPATSSIVGLGGISISTNGSTITISYSSSNTSAPTLGYFENMPFFPTGVTTVSASGSVLQIVPFILPQPISMAFLRIPASFSFVSTSAAGTTANTSFTQNRSYTVAAVIYSNAGGNMSQLQSLTSSFASYVFQTSITAGNTGSQYTLWNNVTYPVSGNYGNYATSVGFTNVSYQNSTGSLTLFTGLRWLDIPFKTSLSAGNYWLGLGCSNATATNAGPALTGASMNPISMYAQSQTNLTFIRPGEASNSSVQVQPGLGSFSTNASQFSIATVPMSAISMQASNPKLYFQMIWST